MRPPFGPRHTFGNETMSDMDFTGGIFEYYGLRQQALAIYLGVNKSTLAMHNTLRRELPPGKFLKLAKLDPQFSRPVPPDMQGQIAMENQKQMAELQRDDRARLRSIKTLTNKAARQLADMKKKERQAVNALGFVANELPDAEPGDHDFLEWMRKDAWARYNENGPSAQAPLERRLALLALEKSLIEQGGAQGTD